MNFDSTQRAELWRRSGGIGMLPDPPMLHHAGKIDDGTLVVMAAAYLSLPRSHQPHHFIRLGTGEMLTEREIQAFAEREKEERG